MQYHIKSVCWYCLIFDNGCVPYNRDTVYYYYYYYYCLLSPLCRVLYSCIRETNHVYRVYIVLQLFCIYNLCYM